MEQLIIQWIFGAVGGNAVGNLVPKLNLGTLGNSAAGLIGGGIGGQLLSVLGAGGIDVTAQGGSMDVTAIIQSFAGGGVGGGMLMVVVGLLKLQMRKV